MKLLEIVRGEKTADDVLSTSMAFAALSTIMRIASISMRALAISSVFLPRRC